MKLEGDYLFDASVRDVWDALFDTAVLAATLPGCEKLDLVDGVLVGEMTIKVGPITGKFTGKVAFEDKVEPVSYGMVIDGRGSQGFVKATATIRIEGEGDGTRLRYDADVQMGGKIASVGQRLLDASARAVTRQSLENLHTNVKIRAAAQREAAAPAAAPAVAAEAGDAAAAAATEAAAPAASASAASSAPEPEPAAAGAPEPAGAAKASEPAVEPAGPGNPSAAAAAPEPAGPGTPSTAATAPVYKRADAGEMAKVVAKEVARKLAPVILLVALAIAAVVWWLARG